MIQDKVSAAECGDKQVMPFLRALLCLVTVLSLALSGAALAARTVHGPVTEMVICGDGGAKTIRFDAKGNPVEGGQCCDCLQCLMLADAPPVVGADCALATRLAPDTKPTLTTLHLPHAARYARPVPRAPPVNTPATCDMQPQPRPSPAGLEFGQVPRGVAMATDGQATWVAR